MHSVSRLMKPRCMSKVNSRPQHLRQLDWFRAASSCCPEHRGEKDNGAAAQQQGTYSLPASRETSCIRMTTAWEAAFILRVWSSSFEVKCRTNLEEWSGFS